MSLDKQNIGEIKDSAFRAYSLMDGSTHLEVFNEAGNIGHLMLGAPQGEDVVRVIEDVQVEKGKKRKGVGTFLVKQAIEITERQGIQTIETRTYNKGLIKAFCRNFKGKKDRLTVTQRQEVEGPLRSTTVKKAKHRLKKEEKKLTDKSRREEALRPFEVHISARLG